jgi:hypothetical protein
MRIIGVLVLTTAALGGASGQAQQLPPAYPPSSSYRQLTCVELAQEGRVISKRGFMLSGLTAGATGGDSTATALATVAVWPVTASAGNRQRSDSLALALKQMDAVEQASIESQCSIRFQRPPAR